MSLGKLITNLQTTFITEDEKDNKNHLSQFQSQGEKYLKYNEMRTDEIKPQFNLIENFSLIKDNAVETKNNSEIQALIDLDKEYKKKLADYSKQRQLLMSDTNTYINKISSAQNKLLGKNVRFNNGEMAYITNEGLFKKYDSSEIYQNTIGKNGCPSNYEKLNININGNKIDTDPPLKSGTPMSLGQSCGNAGKNVYAINSQEPGKPTYVGCYLNSSDNGLMYQSDMGSTADVESCKYRAFDKGNGVFAVGSGGKGSSKCYIGTNVERVKTGVQSKIYKETWNSGGPFPNATMGGLNNAGQLIITNNNNKEVYYKSNPPQEGCDPKYGGGINFSNTIATFGGNCLNVTSNPKIIENFSSNTTKPPTTSNKGLKFNIYNGYFDENVNYFSKQKSIANGYSDNFTNLSTATAGLKRENTNDKYSIEWTGFFVPNFTGTWEFKTRSDDKSYLWLDKNANSGYNINNTLVKNLRRKNQHFSNEGKIKLDANVYYPVRMQFGNKGGGDFFQLFIKSPNGSTTNGLGLFFNSLPPTPTTSTINSKTLLNSNIKLANGELGFVTSDGVYKQYPSLEIYQKTIGKNNCPNNYIEVNVNRTDKIVNTVPPLTVGTPMVSGQSCANVTIKSDTNWNVKQGNWTNYLKTLDIEGKSNGSFVLLNSSAPTPFNVDPAKGCSKDFRANYQCGTGINKNVFINPDASGKAATFNCIEEHKLCKGYTLVMQDDGNLVIYNNKKQATWSSKTTSNIGVNNPEKSASKGKNGRNYLNSGEYLNDGEFIGSPNGNCYLKMTKGVGLQIIISIPGCSDVGNETYGFINTSENKRLNVDSPSSIDSLAVYTIPIFSGYDNIGKVGYVTPDNKLKEYPQNLISRSNNYIELGNFSNPGNDIKTINAKTPEECMTGCNQTNGCEGFVFNPNGTCSLKNSNMYPKTPRIKTSNVNVLYKRSVNLKNNNSCSKNVVPINGSLWGNYVKDGTMSQAVVCNLENYTKEQQVKLEASRKDLQQTITEIHKRLIALDETDKKLLSSYGLTKKNLEKDMSTFQLVYKEKQNINNQANTLQGMQDVSEDEMISENYKNIVWSVVAILLIIGSIKLLK